MSKLFVDEIVHQSSQGSGTITLGASGETINIPSGSTINLSNSTVTLNSDMKNRPAFRAYPSSGQTISNNTQTVLQYNTETFDTDNCYDTSTYKFTPNVAGKYYFHLNARVETADDYDHLEASIAKNGGDQARMLTSPKHYDICVVTVVLEMNGTTDYVQPKIFQGSGSNKSVGTDQANLFFEGYRLIGA